MSTFLDRRRAPDHSAGRRRPASRSQASPFADLRFTDELAFRIGIPITGEAATRESDGKRGLVWTVPVFLTTVLKL